MPQAWVTPAEAEALTGATGFTTAELDRSANAVYDLLRYEPDPLDLDARETLAMQRAISFGAVESRDGATVGSPSVKSERIEGHYSVEYGDVFSSVTTISPTAAGILARSGLMRVASHTGPERDEDDWREYVT